MYTVISSATLMLKNRTKFIYFSPSETSFTIPSSVSEFGKTMFQSCQYLTSIDVETSSTTFSAEEGIVYNKDFSIAIACIGGITSVTLNSRCQQVKDSCFYKCHKLTSVTLNEGLQVLGSNAFYADNFTHINIPSSVHTIGSYCFYGSSLQYITINGDGPSYVYDNCFVWSQLKEIHLGKNLMYLGYIAFYQCYSLETVSFHPDCPLNFEVSQIFQGCTNLKTINIPKNVQKITDRCFEGTTSLTNFVIEEGSKLSYIDQMAFSSSGITSISFPESLTFIGVNAFQFRRNLVAVTFPERVNLTTFGGGIFKSCTSLVTIRIPASVTLFDASSLVYCSNLVSINVSTENRNYVSYQGIVYTINKEKLVCCPGGRISALIYNYIIVIGSNALYGCEKLENLTFEDGCKLETIEDGTFFSCTSLLRVDLPTSLRTVKQNAFSGCTRLSIITFTDFALVNLDSDSIFSDCTSLTTFTFGKFCALSSFGNNIFKNCVSLTSINIPANCTTIGDNAFKNCRSLSNITFEFNSKISSLSNTAFEGCTSLTNYTVPDSYKDITSSCFGGAPSITTVNILPNLHINSIRRNAFSSFDLHFFNIGSNTRISYLEDSSFSNTNIETFSLYNEVTLSSYVFSNCTKLKTVNIPHITQSISSSSKKLKSSSDTNNYYTIPTGLFCGCTSLEKVNINTNINEISDYAFTNCRNLIFNIPSSVERIGDYAFTNCSHIKKFTSNITYIGNFSFTGTGIDCVLKVNKSTEYIGSSSFIYTPVRVVYYCGERDFSKFLPSFQSGVSIVVTYLYPSTVFCGSSTQHTPSNTCSDIIETNIDFAIGIQHQIKNNVKAQASLFFIYEISLGFW
ncbi:surface antigen BspA-like [Trichomonas vaginalis G3]|uniref:Surface antigen BspA-like n=1 Tax=Trichomonas vaginalis (strain ATCC PRA-98 / G3) TaxID=412133 RepID=A2FBN3_TRIV3|nr:leucine-rich repeats (6 copies)-containing protein [Trichomonas vaginalis G3]EAX97670.1 surface antigen BspA-like [Trichomonas vaginalis G3]KAI5486333.1 leucine-rich repeats (6 copies)-containing protein [Trichomonas vaginalis G3]|eukprot:XP_001310600.1 surface antigen BspA-like [Trichomonas vaginalis G3]